MTDTLVPQATQEVTPGASRALAPGGDQPPRAPARHADRARAGVRRVRGLRRPRQLRDEHRGRREVRLPAAVGAARREPDGDAHPEPLGEDGHRDRAQPAAAVPRALPAPGDLGALGPGRAHRDGDRPGRVRRRRDRPEPAVRHPAVPGRGDHRGRRLRDPGAAEPRLPALRAGDRRAAGPDHPRLPLRHAAHRLRRRRRGQGLRPALRRHRLRAARRRHPRRDGHAARDLPALGPHAGPHPAARRRRAAQDPQDRPPRRDDRDGRRRRGQHVDARDRGLAVPRQGPHRRRHHRGGPRAVRRAGRRRRGGGLRGRAAWPRGSRRRASARRRARSSCRASSRVRSSSGCAAR